MCVSWWGWGYELPVMRSNYSDETALMRWLKCGVCTSHNLSEINLVDLWVKSVNM